MRPWRPAQKNKKIKKLDGDLQRGHPLLAARRQDLYFCNSKASKYADKVGDLKRRDMCDLSAQKRPRQSSKK
jgi:hypothetical protein